MRGHCTRHRRSTVLTIDATKVGDDCILQRARCELTAALRLRREVRPEEGVVDVSATDELEGALKLDLVLGCGGLGVGLLGGVEAIHVRLAVLAEVRLHDLARDVRLEGLRRVRLAGDGQSGLAELEHRRM